MSDKLEELVEEQAVLKEREHVLRTMLTSAGWQLFHKQIEASIHAARQMDFDSEIASVDAAFRLSRSRGFMSGLVTAEAMPKALLDSIQMDLDHISVAIEQEQDDATRN